eukprot:TRINITY_DN7774_c0_g1_i4.p1 TRINITY_DN7774_c0_g1~~TRINITY_DN7774_c0_g1_i4.p1  ORF type:complete len:476 (+),score=161.15 TRINITY_DN7774_c0_g1_i4:73-1500(+)
MTAMSVLSVALVSQVATQASGFAEIFPGPLQGSKRSAAPAAAAAAQQPLQAAVVPTAALRGGSVATEAATPVQDGSFIGMKGAAVAGLLAAASFAVRGLRRMGGNRSAAAMRSRTTMHARTIVPAPRGERKGVEGDEPRGPTYRSWLNLRRQARKGQRYWRQQQILKESGITSAKGGFKKWHPTRDTFNFYHGPKSHPDNPWFPAPSPGYDKAAIGPIPDKYRAVPVSQESGFGMFSAVQPASAAGAFVAGRTASLTTSASVKRGLASGCRRQALVIMNSHKKAASSTKNQGHKKNPRHWGIRPVSTQGTKVKAGQVLLKQKGYQWYDGANVIRGRDYTLNAAKEGVIMWRGLKDDELGQQQREGVGLEAFVVPWQFIEEKCDKIVGDTFALAPKKYEPWMHPSKNQPKLTRERLTEMRAAWLESDEGKAAVSKKEEKQKKQQEINAAWRAKTKANNLAKMKEAGVYSPREKVSS